MAQAKTNAVEMRMGTEATFGTVATAMVNFPYLTFDLTQSQNQNDSNVIRTGRDFSQPFLGFKTATATAEVPLTSIAIGYFLKAMLGTASAPVDNLDGTWTHTFTASSEIPSISLEKAYTDVARFHLGTGFKIVDGAINYGGEDEPTMSFNFAGVRVATSGAQTVAPTQVIDGVKFEPFESGLTGATNVTTADVTISNNLQTDQYIIGSGGELASLPEGKVGAEGTFEAYYEDDTYITDALGSIERSLTMTYAKALNKIEFIMQEIMLGTPSVTSAGEGQVQSVPFKAFFGDGTNGQSISVKLTNTSNVQY